MNRLLTPLRTNWKKPKKERKKFYADQKRRDHNFTIGDLVYVKICPYRQQSLIGTTYSKLSKHFYGPYKIMDQFGPIAFKLDLPFHSKIHHVFHFSILKPYHGPITTTPDDLPSTNIDNNPLIQPLAILDTKMDTILGFLWPPYTSTGKTNLIIGMCSIFLNKTPKEKLQFQSNSPTTTVLRIVSVVAV